MIVTDPRQPATGYTQDKVIAATADSFGFAKQSGVDVDVTSEVDVGTTFKLYLPEVAADKASSG